MAEQPEKQDRLLDERQHRAQKPDAMRGLTGRVAHDFNNLLAIIQGYTQLCIENEPGGDAEERRQNLEQINKAVERATALTRRLMASGGHGRAEPQDLGLDNGIEDAARLLRPAVHERILVVDDDPDGRGVLCRALRKEGYPVAEAVDGVEALDKVGSLPPDLILTDVMMPGMDGYELCRRLKHDPRTRLIPVIMLTSLDKPLDRVRALELDADDYLSKPYNLTVLRARVRSLLRLKHSLDEMENAAGVLQAVAGIVEKRDAYTSTHCQEVAYLATELGGRLDLDPPALGRLRLAATFHDIGKIGISDALLRKPGPLDEAERKAMQEHPGLGEGLLKPMRTMQGILHLVRHHHERLDGSGYPDGLCGDALSLELRVLSVVDIYQALVMQRSYKPAFSPAKALGILREEARKGWWDPGVVESLASLLESVPHR